jgi:hypothetical protein
MLTDSTSTDQLASVARDLLAFLQADHRFVVTVTTHVDPSRENDA